MEGRHRLLNTRSHQSHSQRDTAAGTTSSVLSPAAQVEDHASSAHFSSISYNFGMQWRRSVINLGGSRTEATSISPPILLFSFPFVDSQEVWAEPAHPLPNILMQFMQSNSFRKSTLMFNVLPGTEISVHAEFSHCRQN